MNVLIVGINYAPELTSVAPYTTGLAEHLVSIGCSVEVLTGLPCYPEWRVPEGYRRGLRFPEQRNGVAVRRLRHYVPAQQDALRRGAYEFSFLGHAAACTPVARPDVVIGVTPALGGAVAAALLARRYGARLVLVVQDLVGSAATQSGIAGGNAVAGAAGRLESFALRRANAVAVVAEAFRPQVEAYGVAPERIAVVPNWSHVPSSAADRAAVRASMGWGPELTVALHSGNMGQKQDLGNIVEAARLTRDRSDLLWVLMGDGSQRAALQELGAGLPNLRFLPLCPAETFPDVLAAADVLLLNERASVVDMSLPSKLTSYFTSGRPVAACVVPDGASARELARAGAPTPAPPGEPAALVSLVDRLCADPEAGARYGLAAQSWARERLTATTSLRAMERLVSPRHPLELVRPT
ncbi:MAG: WcaI family glycosyltransferase [Sporichthyaceae bacterium]